ncbi:MAG: inorganic phosphate transporter, partial [Spirochaetia bacterium]
MLRLISGIFMGWALGANDSSNIFGAAVETKSIRFLTAAILCAIFVVTGAVLEGGEGLDTIGGITSQTLHTAFLSATAAALAVSLMTLLKLPVSTSQALIGAILGIGITGSQTI